MVLSLEAMVHTKSPNLGKKGKMISPARILRAITGNCIVAPQKSCTFLEGHKTCTYHLPWKKTNSKEVKDPHLQLLADGGTCPGAGEINKGALGPSSSKRGAR